MDDPKSFEIVVRNKVPYLTNFLMYLLMVCFIVFVFAYIIFLPTKYISGEMKFTYFILSVPNFLKIALIYSTIGFIIILPIYTYFRLYRNALLTFLPDKIIIERKSIKEEILIKKITTVLCMDPQSRNGESKNKLTLYFEYRKRKSIRVRLKNYTQADDFVNRLIEYKNLNIKFYDFETNLSSAD
jgi:hypothetical protein